MANSGAVDGIDAWLRAAIAATDRAGEIIRPYFRVPLDPEEKTDESPVTRADREAEQAMRTLLTEACPDHGVLGEEFGLDRPEAPLRWVLDPIDGTRAFITGRPVFGTLVALLQDGVPLIGIIDQPVTGERWIGVRGRKTTFRDRFGGRIGVRACATLDQAELSATDPAMFDAAETARWRTLQAAVKRNSWGGDCYAYGLLALGQIDIVAESSLKLWDWAAILPVVEGAGGAVTDWSGNTLTPDGDGKVLAVGDKALLPLAVARLAQDG